MATKSWLREGGRKGAGRMHAMNARRTATTYHLSDKVNVGLGCFERLLRTTGRHRIDNIKVFGQRRHHFVHQLGFFFLPALLGFRQPCFQLGHVGVQKFGLLVHGQKWRSRVTARGVFVCHQRVEPRDVPYSVPTGPREECSRPRRISLASASSAHRASSSSRHRRPSDLSFRALVY